MPTWIAHLEMKNAWLDSVIRKLELENLLLKLAIAKSQVALEEARSIISITEE
jgi:hypothetical protein